LISDIIRLISFISAAILPAIDEWNDGILLPASFVFEHHLNKNNSPCVYADVIVTDCAARTEVNEFSDRIFSQTDVKPLKHQKNIMFYY